MQTTLAGRDEARERVDVPVGVVVQEAVAEPEDLLDAERLLDSAASIGLGDIPELRFRFSRHWRVVRQRALAVDLDGAALEDPGEAVRGRSRRRPATRVGRPRSSCGKDVLAAPAVERERGRGARVARRRRGRSGAVSRSQMSPNGMTKKRAPRPASAVAARRPFSSSGTSTFRRSPRGAPDGPAVRDRGGEPRERVADTGQRVLPEIRVARPREPDGLVDVPLGGLAEAVGAGRRADPGERRGHRAGL